MAIFYGEVIARNSREVLFSLAVGRGDARKLGLRGQVWFPLASIQVVVDPETQLDALICPTEIALLRRTEVMAEESLTRAELEEYVARNERRLELQREADALDAANKLVRPRIIAFIEKFGNRSLAISKWGFNLAIKLVQGRVNWQNEFLSVSTPERVAELKNNAPKEERLSVERAP